MNYLVVVFIALFSIQFSFGQMLEVKDRHQVGVTTGFGISHRLFERVVPNDFTKFDHLKTQTRFETGGTIKYSYRILKSRGLFVTAGYDYSTIYMNHKLIDPKYNMHLDNIAIRTARSSIRLGVNQQIELYGGSLVLNFGAYLLKHIPHHPHQTYSMDFVSNNEDWIRYKYSYDLYNGKFFENEAGISERQFNRINAELGVDAFFKIARGYVTLGIGYARNNYRFYDYTYQVEYYENGNPQPQEIYTFFGSELKYGIRDHFYRVKVGYLLTF